MTANVGLSVVVVDPAYSSRWGTQHVLAPYASTIQSSPGTTLRRWCPADAAKAAGPGAACGAA